MNAKIVKMMSMAIIGAALNASNRLNAPILSAQMKVRKVIGKSAIMKKMTILALVEVDMV
jgi:hypothetical protein